MIEPSLSVGARGRSALGGRAALVPFEQPAQSSSLATTGRPARLVVLRAAENRTAALTRPKRVDRRCYAYGLFTDV